MKKHTKSSLSISPNSNGEIGTIVVVMGFGFMLLSTLLLTLQSNNNQVTIQSRANSNCAEIQSLSYSPTPIDSAGVITCNGQINQAHSGSYTIACGWSKNGGWPQNGGLWQGATCEGVSCNFQIRMDQYTQGTTDRYELVMFDMKEECGPATGRKIDLALQSSVQPTQASTPIPQSTPIPTSGPQNTPTSSTQPTTRVPTNTQTPTPTFTRTPTPTNTVRPTAIPTCPPNKFRCGSACYPMGEDCTITNTPTPRPTSTPTKTPTPTNTPPASITPLPTTSNTTPTPSPIPTQEPTLAPTTPTNTPPAPTTIPPTPTNLPSVTPTPIAECIPLSTNSVTKDILDIVYVPAGYTSLDTFIGDARRSIEEIKKTNLGRNRLQKMNFIAYSDISVDYKIGRLSDDPNDNFYNYINVDEYNLSQTNALKCTSDVTFVLINNDTFSAFAFSGNLRVEITRNPLSLRASAHELGHAIASLKDEYQMLDNDGNALISNSEDTPQNNCYKMGSWDLYLDSSLACPGWEKYTDATCIQSCYYADWFRSTNHSTMNSVSNTDADYVFNQISLDIWDDAMINY